MREDFLHYLWKYKKFDTSDLYTTNFDPVIIVNLGDYHQLAGPDFFNAQLIIGGQRWAGNVEIHMKSSDWYAHKHEADPAYENVILHVVWERDVDVYRSDQSEIPVLELRHFVDAEAIENFTTLISQKSWIFCERQLNVIDPFLIRNWLERIFFERLEAKSHTIQTLLERSSGDWEAVLFCMLAKNFGLNTNGESFLKIASQIPFAIIRKECGNSLNLESLFFGYAHLLDEDKEDIYCTELKHRFAVLKQKHQLDDASPLRVEFFKHRPDNFPTIRLAQLAALYAREQQLFSRILAAGQLEDYYDLFHVSVSPYWLSHYQFDRLSPDKQKFISRSFIDLLIINTIIPVRFAYAKYQGSDISETLVGLLSRIKAETNNIISKFAGLDLNARNALESQALLHLKSSYCDRGRCLECAIGVELLKQTHEQNV
ncbi:MAG TPA: DUF2851 family protein [Flavobacterium sp.]|jgi:hypothetical protein